MESLKNKSTLFWIFKNTKKQLPSVVIACLLSIVTALTFVALALFSKQILDIATGNAEGSYLFCAFMILLIIALQIITSGLENFIKARANAKLTVSIRNDLFVKISKKKYEQFSKYHTGDLLNRFTSDVEVVLNGVTKIIPDITYMLAKIAGGVIALIFLSPKIALAFLGLGILISFIGRIISQKFKYLHKQVQQTEGDTRSFLQECFENIVVIKTFLSQEPFTKRLNKYLRHNYTARIKKAGFSMLSSVALYAVFTIGYYAVLIWGAGKISQGVITYGTLMAFLQLISQLKAPLQNVSGILPQYYAALASAERLMEIENSGDEVSAVESKVLKQTAGSFKTLELKNVTFSYGGENIFKNCNAVFERGKITAITGESGVGKSTLFKLLLGLFDASNGEILLDTGEKVDAALRGIFAYVPQGNMILSGTLRDNIAMYDSSITDEQIIEAVRIADIKDIIEQMPKGLDTLLSERGGGLSEGQIQRISIARALLCKAPILLLDEATSALDAKTEQKVLENIKSIDDKTVIFITHRNTGLKVCDSILHLKDGDFKVIK